MKIIFSYDIYLHGQELLRVFLLSLFYIFSSDTDSFKTSVTLHDCKLPFIPHCIIANGMVFGSFMSTASLWNILESYIHIF